MRGSNPGHAWQALDHQSPPDPSLYIWLQLGTKKSYHSTFYLTGLQSSAWINRLIVWVFLLNQPVKALREVRYWRLRCSSNKSISINVLELQGSEPRTWRFLLLFSPLNSAHEYFHCFLKLLPLCNRSIANSTDERIRFRQLLTQILPNLISIILFYLSFRGKMKHIEYDSCDCQENWNKN